MFLALLAIQDTARLLLVGFLYLIVRVFYILWDSQYYDKNFSSFNNLTLRDLILPITNLEKDDYYHE
jgi:hypothetical protein